MACLVLFYFEDALNNTQKIAHRTKWKTKTKHTKNPKGQATQHTHKNEFFSNEGKDEFFYYYIFVVVEPFWLYGRHTLHYYIA